LPGDWQTVPEQDGLFAAKAVGAAAIATAATPAASSGVMYFSFISMMALLKALNYCVLVYGISVARHR
jgi:hypothetical protein